MSGAYVPYHLRQNKAVDRHLFIDLLIRINRYKSVKNYTYVSFGGPFLEDLKLVHSHFGNEKLISIEEDKNVIARQKFNLPISCIECRLQKSGDFIAEFNFESDTVIWLDYADPKKIRLQLAEFQTLLGKLKVGDVARLTLNANPEVLRASNSRNEFTNKPETREERQNLRLDELKKRIGEYISPNTESEMMTAEFLPRVYCSAVEYAANEAMSSQRRFDEFFQPLTLFRYNDSEHQMLTVTGIILNKREKINFFQKTDLKKWPLASKNWADVKKINVPALTAREKLFMDKMLPKYSAKTIHKKLGFKFHDKDENSIEVIENYKNYYRYYPSFHKVNF